MPKRRAAPGSAPRHTSSLPINEPLAAAERIAAAAERAWHGAGAGTDEGACVGMIAALALLGQADPQGPDPRDQILDLGDEEIAQLLREVWRLFTISRPELAMRCGPFGEWLNAEPLDRHLLGGAGAVVRAAVTSGLLELTLDLEVSRQVDLLGVLYTMMRSHGARKARGEFYTPPAVAEAMAGMTLAGLSSGQSICDPAAGTGGLLRAAAAALRAEGKDPHEYLWFGCDIAPVAVAGLAVNATPGPRDPGLDRLRRQPRRARLGGAGAARAVRGDRGPALACEDGRSAGSDEGAVGGGVDLSSARHSEAGRHGRPAPSPESLAARRRRLELVRAELARSRSKDPAPLRGPNPKAASGAPSRMRKEETR